MPIAEVLALPTDVPDDQRPRVKIAGRIVSRRIQGKVHFLDLWDWSGKPVKKLTKSDAGDHEQTEILGLVEARSRSYMGQKQVGELGWKVAQEPTISAISSASRGPSATRAAASRPSGPTS